MRVAANLHQLLLRFTVERENLVPVSWKELPFGAPSLSIMALCAHHAGKAARPGNAGDICAVYGGVFYCGR